ncbi:MAG TPA: DUF3277 domain-containing protein [Pelotomaculum sp.]|nr:DUF3277 domain-containing protein [Pelotomaculum sp.]
MYTTYSFADVSVVIKHPSVGRITANGEGLGNISISMATDRTAHDVAADGTVMVSKIRGRNGTVSIATQQSSSLNRWLKKWYNYLETADADEWADATITIRSNVMDDHHTITGVSPQKQPDRPYQAQGQQVTWTLMAADIQQD